jgi:ADP-ribosylglycohydrolase
MGSDRQLIRDVCRITHRNDEAYTGALAIVEGIKCAVSGEWSVNNTLIPVIIEQLPDTRVRDRLIDMENETAGIGDIAKKYGNSGYVVHSVPLALYAAQQIGRMGFEEIFTEIIKAGGDTDTTCSMAGNLMGALIGHDNIPPALLNRLRTIKEAALLEATIARFCALATSIQQ